MDISEKEVENVRVIALGGWLDAQSANDVEIKLKSLIDKGQVRLVIDFVNLEYISSAGLRVLLSALKKVRKLQGDMKVACFRPDVKKVFDISGFTVLFNIFDAVETAICSFEE